MLLEEFDSNRFAVINPDMCADKTWAAFLNILA